MSTVEERLEAENHALRAEIAALERRRDELRRERDKFRDLYAWAPDMCASIDLDDAKIVECNERSLEELGYARAELLGSSVLTIIDPEDRSPLVEAVGRLLEAGELRDLEVRFVRRDGSSMWVSLNITVGRDAQSRARYGRGVARDITAQKAVEDALALSEARLRGLTETLDVIPWQVTARLVEPTGDEPAPSSAPHVEYEPGYIGPQFEKVFGYQRSGWTGPESWASLIHPDDVHGVLERGANRMDCAGPYRDEFRMFAADGSVRSVLHLGRITIEPDGRRVVSGVLVDISERRAAESAETLAMRELDHRVRNSFATVESVMNETLTGSSDIEPFLATFRGRISALAAIHNAMASSDWKNVDLHELVESSLAPFGEAPRVHTEGPPIRVTVDAARSLGMILHELATNALKHGALSETLGTITVRWRVEEAGGRGSLHIDWREAGGPPAHGTSRRGYGMRLIESLLSYEELGDTELHWAESGLRCEIMIHLGDAPLGPSPPAQSA